MFTRRTSWSREKQPLALALERRISSGADVIDLTESNPTRCGFALDAHRFANLLTDSRGRIYDPNPRGLAVARKAVAGYYANRGERVDGERIVLTTGTSESYGNLFRLLAEPGDEVLVPAPSYPLFDFIARIHDVTLKPYRLTFDGAWRLDRTSVDRAWTDNTRAVLAVSPNNPTGSYLSPGEREFLQAKCRSRDAALIVDEVFHDFRWEPNDNRPGGFSADSPCLTFLLNGLSKIAACPQLKLGWIVTGGPAQLADEARRRLEILADTYLSVSTPIQLATEHVLSLASEMQAALLRRIRRNLGSLDQALTGSALSRLEGRAGWYAVLRIPQLTPDEQLAIELIEQTGLHVHPGNLFGFNSGAHWVVSLISREEAFRNGVSRILEFWGRRG